MKNNLHHLKDLLVSQNAGEWGSDPIGADALPILRAGNIADEGWIDLEDVVCRTIAEPKRSKILLKSGDILLEKSGGTDTRPVGRVAYIETNLNAGFSNFLHCLRPNPLIIQPRYLFFVLMYWHSSGRAVALQTRTTGIRNLMFARYLSEPIRVPLMVQQICVSRILELSTSSLSKIDRLIAAKREQKRGLMQQLLTGKLRFPGFTEPWQKSRIGELLEEVARPVTWSDNCIYRLVSVRRRNGGLFLREMLAGSEIASKSLYTARTGDLLISKMQVVHGAIAIVPEALDGTHISGMYLCLKARSTAKIETKFINLIACLPLMRRLTISCAHGVHIEKMTFDSKKFMNLQLYVPSSIEEQRKVIKVFDLLETEIELLEQQRAAFAAQRRGLMEKLLSGEIDIQNPKETAA